LVFFAFGGAFPQELASVAGFCVSQ